MSRDIQEDLHGVSAGRAGGRERADPDVHGLEGRIFTVNKASIGGIYDVPVQEHVKVGIRGLVSAYGIPGEIKPFYGGSPTSFMLFGRVKVQ